MSVVSLLNVNVKNNPAPFAASYEFEITFECLEPLQKDLEWKLTYVGSATSSEHDQELDSLLVGPVPVGVNKFLFEADPPNLTRIPDSEIIGVTVILLTCSYDGREFVRVGYYVNNEYTDDALNAEPPAKPVIEKVRRNILAEKPRVTRFAIKWDTEESAPAEFPPEQPEADAAEDDENAYGAEEVEEQLIAEASTDKIEEGEDADMGGIEDSHHIRAKLDDQASDAGSEDLEAESSGSEDEVEDEDGDGEGEGDAEGEAQAEGDAEGDGDEDMDMDMDEDADQSTHDVTQEKHKQVQQHADVMVH